MQNALFKNQRLAWNKNIRTLELANTLFHK
jgi:hypothetical protein